MSAIQWISLVIVLCTYAGIAYGRVPGLHMNRTTITLVGAGALFAIRAINEQQAFAAIDLGTIMLLFSMMVIQTNLRLAGFFDLIGNRVLKLAHSPRMLLALVIVASGVLSALFLNDPVCLLFTPLVANVTRQAKRDPIPYLIGLATSANIGSTATITGNPQNLIIGQASHIPYLTFLEYLAPVALAGLLICWLAIVVLFPAEFRGRLDRVDLPEPKLYRPLLWRSLVIVSGLLIAFLVGLPIASSAFVAAALLLISRLRATRLFDLGWELLVFFVALFMVTGAIEVTGLSTQLFAILSPILRSGVPLLSLVTAALSNLISNVPAVLLLRSEVPNLPNVQQAWLTLAMASTLAGNLTLLGSVANLIVAEVASAWGIKLSFTAYLRVGIPITIATILVGVFWLSLVH